MGGGERVSLPIPPPIGREGRRLYGMG